MKINQHSVEMTCTLELSERELFIIHTLLSYDVKYAQVFRDRITKQFSEEELQSLVDTFKSQTGGILNRFGETRKVYLGEMKARVK